MKHKKQHLVPSSYIATWCDPDTPTKQTPYVWRFTKNGSRSEKKAPKNIFTQTDAYTIKEPDGTRNLILEKGLCELETRFAQLRDKKVAQRIPLNEEDRFLLCAFMATMMSRTASQREHWDDRKWQELPTFLQDKPVIRESVEISLPISPRQLVFLNWKDVTGYIQIDERIVNEANARTRFNAHEYFVVSKNMKRPEWFME